MWSSVALSGCICTIGGGDDDTNENPPTGGSANAGGAASGGAGQGGAETPIQSCTFALASASPAAGATDATPNAKIVLTFSEAVDPASVSKSTVRLRERESKREVPATLDVNGDTITITPIVPLGGRSRYSVDYQAASLADASCTATDTFGFRTQLNFTTLYIRYIDGLEDRADVYTWNAADRTLAVDFYAPGPDGQLLTADDPEDVRSLYTYDEGLDETSAFNWTGAGADGLWATADDFNNLNRHSTHSAAGITAQYYEYFGPDGLVGTDDDTVSPTTTFDYDANDVYLGSCDDTSCTTSTPGTNEETYTTSIDPGDDGVFRTADDVLAASWSRSVTDDYGVPSTYEVHLLAPDGTATITPGSLQYYVDYTVSGERIVGARAYKAAGPDGVWRTADDVGDTLSTYGYDADGLRTTTEVYLAGPDDLLGTADDVIYQEFFY